MIKRTIKEWYRYLRGDADLVSLKKRGMQVGNNVSLQPHCMIDVSHCWLISIGNDVTIAPRVTILAHDASSKKRSGGGYTKIGLVRIGDRAFIGAGALILPGVTIGSDSIIGAGSVVTHDIPSDSIAVGVPARVVSTIRDRRCKLKAEIAESPCFDEAYTLAGGITDEMKYEMVAALERSDGKGFVR